MFNKMIHHLEGKNASTVVSDGSDDSEAEAFDYIMNIDKYKNRNAFRVKVKWSGSTITTWEKLETFLHCVNAFKVLFILKNNCNYVF
jgi:hypothetical protein